MTSLLLVPLDDTVVFPTMDVTLPVDAGDETRVLLVPRHEGEFAKVGTIAEVTDQVRLPGGGRAVSLSGVARGVAGAAHTDSRGRLRVEVAEHPDDIPVDGRTRVAEREYRAVVEEILELRGADERVAAFLRAIVEPGALADTIGYAPDVPFEQKVQVLETLDVTERIELAVKIQRERLTELQLRKKIREDVQSGAEAQQREYFLRKQMESIQRELGEDSGSVAEEYRKKIAESGMPDDVREQATKELGRLERMGEQSGEASMIRSYLDWLIAVPWGERSDEKLDPVGAREVLDTDHAGLEDVKDRITEYLAVRKLRTDRGIAEDKRSGAILTLIGPPGTGKTSIGESIARATGREFVRMSLGGVRDEAEIRGHRRTYIGALPGRLVRALRDAGTMNPVIMLDEVDKVGADWRGDPSAALLEVLDPAQNHAFRDHYLDVELDLSQVLFIATANVAETIPGPLLDRMEVIRFDGYTVAEKIAIARGYLWPRQRERNGLREDEVTVSDETLRLVVDEYTREAGVRNLERELGTVLRKTATRIASAKVEAPVEVTTEIVRDALGRQKFFQEAAVRTAVPGVATGLAVTGVGGDVLFVEATRMKGKEGLVLTGQLGDVMKESARIALSYVRGHAEELGIAEDAFEDREFHVHVPAGAIPKDGPSAGVTMTTALASLLYRPPGQAHGRHDRRGHAPGPGAADRRAQAEGARRPRGRAHRRDPARAQPRRPGRRPRRRARADDVPPGDEHRRGARRRPRACGSDGVRLTRRVVALFRPHRARLGAVLALILVSAGLGMVSPFLLREVLDVAIPEKDRELLAWLVGGMIAISIATGVLGVGQTWLSNVVGQRVMHDLRTQVYRHLQRLSLAFFTRTRTGEIQSRIANDIGGVQTVVTTTATSIVSNVTTVIASVVAMFLLDWRLALFSLGLTPLFVLLARRVGNQRKRIAAVRQGAMADISSLVQESLSVSGILLGKTMGRGAELADRFEGESERLADLEVRSRMAGRWTMATVQTSFAVMPALVYLFAGLSPSAVSIGTVVAFTTLQTRLFWPLQSLLNVGVDIQTSTALFDRVFEYLDLAVDIHPGTRELHGVRGEVEFDDVWFSYDSSDSSAGTGEPTLRGITLDVPAGTRTALVGETGSGKTTLGYLAARLYDPDRGAVLLDGARLQDLTLDSVAEAVGVVSQETYLFHASVRENLRFAKPEATDEEIEEAARAAQIHETIAALPDGYDTVVGERGFRFSGGEKQRIAIARTILRNPPVLVLDEATSALDVQTERAVGAALERLAEGRTTIVIAHRLSTVRDADQIVVLDKGEIVERGTHEDLLARGGRYAELVARDVDPARPPVTA